MFSYAVTCLKWGDDPNNTFTILFSKKTNIIDIKLKILKRLNLSNDMIGKIKYYKVNEELYSDDKRFNLMKSKDSYKLISPEQIFNITKVNDVSSLIVSFTDVENSFNTEESIGAIIVVDDESIKKIDDITNIQSMTNEISGNKKLLENENKLSSYNDFSRTFYCADDDDENYNGDYEDDLSESDNKQDFRKINMRSRKEKTKRQLIQKEEREDIKNRMGNCKMYMCCSIKDNNCPLHKKQEIDGFKSTSKSNNIPTPTEDIINMGAKVTLNDSILNSKYNSKNLLNRNTSPTFMNSISPNKIEAITIKQSTPQSIQYSPAPSQDINTNTNSNISGTSLKNMAESSDISALNRMKNDLVIKEETVEKIIQEDIPDLQTKSIKVQCTSNEKLNQNPDFLISGNSMEPVLYTDSIPIQETIITEDESRINPQTLDTSYYPRTTMTPMSNININGNRDENNSLSSNKVNENYNTYTTINNFTKPSRIYYPESDIEVMEFNKNMKPSAPSEHQVHSINYMENRVLNVISNISQYNHSTSELPPPMCTTASSQSTGSIHKEASTSPESRPARPPSISKSIIFGVDQFPSPPKPEDEIDITNSQVEQSSQSINSKRGEVVVHHYYRSDLNDLPPSYENIDQQPSAPSLSAFNSNTTLLENTTNNNKNMDNRDGSLDTPNSLDESTSISSNLKDHSNCCGYGCYPCNYLDECMAEKLNIPAKWIGIIKAICVLLLLIISGLIVFFIVFFSQHHGHEHQLDYSIYTITKVTTTVSGTNTIAKTLVHRPLTIEEKGRLSEPTPRSITSNTNEVDDFIIESNSKNSDEGLIKWTIKELTDPYLISSYFKPGSQVLNDESASATFQINFDRIVEINDTIDINESESYFNLKVPKDKINFAFFINNDSKTNVDIIKFSQYFEDEATKLNVTLNYLFTSQLIEIQQPKYAYISPQAARCFIEIENWNYKYENSKFVLRTDITSTDLVWSVKDENVINLNSSEGKINLNNDVETSRIDNKRNATLSLYEDIVDFEDEGPIEVYLLIDNVQKSNYLLADIEVLLRSNILDIMTKEYEQNVSSPVSSSTTSQYSNNHFNFIKYLFNLTIFNNRYFSIQSLLLNLRHMKILSIFIIFLIHLLV